MYLQHAPYASSKKRRPFTCTSLKSLPRWFRHLAPTHLRTYGTQTHNITGYITPNTIRVRHISLKMTINITTQYYDIFRPKPIPITENITILLIHFNVYIFPHLDFPIALKNYHLKNWYSQLNLNHYSQLNKSRSVLLTYFTYLLTCYWPTFHWPTYFLPTYVLLVRTIIETLLAKWKNSKSYEKSDTCFKTTNTRIPVKGKEYNCSHSTNIPILSNTIDTVVLQDTSEKLEMMVRDDDQ